MPADSPALWIQAFGGREWGQCREYMAGAGAPDLPAPREVAYLLARFSCNSHTICDEELQVAGETPHPLPNFELRRRGGSCSEATVSKCFDHDVKCPLVPMSG